MEEPIFLSPAFIAPNATIRGKVILNEGSSVFYGTVIRAETAPCTIGKRTNIQDNCVLHVNDDAPIFIGNDVTVGHAVILHGCTIGDNCVIGMGSIILNHAVIGDNCIIGAGALVTQGTIIPDGCMAFGSPAKVRRPLTAEEIEINRRTAMKYVDEANYYRKYEQK